MGKRSFIATAVALLSLTILSGIGNGRPKRGQGRPNRPAAPPVTNSPTVGTPVVVPVARSQAIVGFADLHTHHMGQLNFDGEWLTGLASGPQSSALKACTNPVHALGAVMGRKSHLQASQGNPSFRDWPAWNDIQHQQVYETWLKKAHDDGLQIMVASMSSFEPLCRAFKLIRLKRDAIEDCRDMKIVEKQFNAIVDFERTHDWYKIVKSPAEARTAIAQGKLAVVLGIEVSNLFDEDHFGPWRQQLDTWFDRGVRTIIIAHEIDNRFGKAATHDQVFRFLDLIKSHKNLDDQQTLITELFAPNANADSALTDKGEALVQAMIDKKMLLDIAHLDTGAAKEAVAIAIRNQNYPLFNSHTYLHETVTEDEKKHTKHIDVDLVRAIKKSANTCHGSSRSFAQGYALATMGEKVSVAFGTDMNGMIESIGPRFASGDDSCGWAYHSCSSIKKLVGGCDAYKDERTQQQALQGSARQNGLRSEFDTKGMARIDLLDDLVADLSKLGLDTTPLSRSAENFVAMWERNFQTDRRALSDAMTVRLGRCGSDQSDFACEMSKEERSAWAKSQKSNGSCKSDTECGAGLFCDRGTATLGSNTCKRKLDEGSTCSRDLACASNQCISLKCVTPASKNLQDACYVNAECRTGHCSAAASGLIAGKCVCSADADCGNSQFCNAGLDMATNKCEAKKPDNESCAAVGGAHQCQSGRCDFARCVSNGNIAMGGTCFTNNQCRAGKCSSLEGTKGTCVCSADADCSSRQWCDQGVDAHVNSCKDKLPDGAECGKAGELGVGHRCLSGSCKIKNIASSKLECK
jgi:microsomal dipeptidase-like Zn-dependent dipeptidase